MTRRRRFRRRFAAAVALLAALGAILATDYWRRLQRQPIDVDNASTRELVGWFALRDLSVESPEIREELFEKYFAAISASVAQEENETAEKIVSTETDAKNDDRTAEIGEIVEFDANDEPSDAETNGAFGAFAKNRALPKTNATGKTKIALSSNAKRFAGTFLAGRDEKLAEWAANRTRPAYWRLDYVVVAQTPRTSEYVLSGDVRPGPALRERWEKSRADAFENKGKRGKTSGGGKSVVALEQNVKLMIMQWFETRFREYDATPDARKKAKIERCADELLRLQELYNELLGDATGATTATRADGLREFEATCEGWLEIASVEEVAKALYFKDLLEAVLAARETPFGKSGAYPRRVFVSDEEKATAAENSPLANVRRTVGDAIKRFVWKDATATEAEER